MEELQDFIWCKTRTHSAQGSCIKHRSCIILSCFNPKPWILYPFFDNKFVRSINLKWWLMKFDAKYIHTSVSVFLRGEATLPRTWLMWTSPEKSIDYWQNSETVWRTAGWVTSVKRSNGEHWTTASDDDLGEGINRGTFPGLTLLQRTSSVDENRSPDNCSAVVWYFERRQTEIEP